MENKDKLIESIQELKQGLNLLSRERKVVMPHNKTFDHVDKLITKVDEIIDLAEIAKQFKGDRNGIYML